MANQRPYNKYQYETSPRKVQSQPEYAPKKKPYSTKKKSTVKTKEIEIEKQKNNHKKTKQELNSKAKLILEIAIGFAVLLTISYRNSMINESFSQVKGLKTQLASIQKENDQLEVSIQNSLNLQNVEQEAKELLGMQKINGKQTRYISLPKKDYVEPASEEVMIKDSQNWIEKLVNAILGKE